MDGVDAIAANTWPPIWSLIRGYLTPATLFLLVNLVIGTIALTSRSHRRRHPDHHHHPAGDLLAAEEYHHQQEQQYQPPPAPLARTSSVLDRLRSLGLYRFRSGDFPPEYSTPNPTPEEEEEKQQRQYERSRSEPAPEKEKPARIKKSSSESKRAPVQPARAALARTPARVEEAAAEGVDARADDFINKFRQQLQLQRLNSLLNYKEMLNRGK